MLKEKRKTARKPMRYTAWVALENSQLHGCVVADISDTGARLDVENSDRLPERFVLRLSGRGGPPRHCRIMWRAPHQIGVQFEKRIGDPVKVTPAKPNGGVVTAEPAADAAESA